MNEKKPKNDTELIAMLWGQVRHLQNQLHAIHTQAWALAGRKEVADSKCLSNIAKNISELSDCVYSDEKSKDGTVLFSTPTDALKRGAVRLVQLGWKTGWSDFLGWDDSRDNFADQNRLVVECFGGDPYAEREMPVEEVSRKENAK